MVWCRREEESHGGPVRWFLLQRIWIHEPFIVINADDYYGKEAFRKLHDWLQLPHEDTAIAMAGFILKNTLSEHMGDAQHLSGGKWTPPCHGCRRDFQYY